jgi:tetratricopeptide (TPR) repeat protein
MEHKTSALLIMLLLFSCFISFGQTGEDANKLYSEGKNLFKQYRFEEAIEQFVAAVEIIKNHCPDRKADLGCAYYWIGECYRLLGQYDKALEYFQNALAIAEELGRRSDIATYLNNIAMVYAACGRYDEALEYYPYTHRPNPIEIRAQFHHANTLDSPGAIYYRFPDSYYSLKDQVPEVWDALKNVGAEAAELTEVLNSRDTVPVVSMSLNGNRINYSEMSTINHNPELELNIEITVASWSKCTVLNKFNLRYWIRKHKNHLYNIGLVNGTYYPHLLITIHLSFKYKKVYQFLNNRLIIDRSEVQNIITHFDKTDVIIRSSDNFSEDDIKKQCPGCNIYFR